MAGSDSGGVNMDNRWMPTTAGILCIVAGALSLLGWIIVVLGIVLFGTLTQAMSYVDLPRWLPAVIGIIAVPGVLIDVLAIVGGAYALRRRYWGLALAASIAALLGSFFLGVAALVFVIMGKKEFS
jgi:hypothetical protein